MIAGVVQRPVRKRGAVLPQRDDRFASWQMT
jgi:hypothetical protein